MKRTARRTGEDEPMGIVISAGVREDRVPTVRAYVWAAPDTPSEPDAEK